MRRWALPSLLLLGCTPRGELTVFAASSLKESFEAIARGAPARLSFAGSQELRLQLQHGARADVFASADPAQMERLAEAGLVDTPLALTCNALVIAVRKDSPHRIESLAALAQADRLILAAPEVPAGRYTQALLQTLEPEISAAIEGRVISRELNVRQVLTRLLLGEADAGIVYRTDALTAPQTLALVPLPQSPQVVYEIAQVRASTRPEAAEGWIARAVAMREIFQERGFVDCR